MNQRYPKQNFARRLRKNQTDAERCLWQRLRNKQLAGCKFRRQYAIGKYVVDFICLERGLIVEIDGGQHLEALVITHDRARTMCLNSQGFKILRFWDNDVLRDTEAVLESILISLDNQPLTPTLSPGRGEGD